MNSQEGCSKTACRNRIRGSVCLMGDSESPVIKQRDGIEVGINMLTSSQILPLGLRCTNSVLDAGRVRGTKLIVK